MSPTNDDRAWHIHSSQGSQGPYTVEEIRGWYSEGRVRSDTMVWRDGMAEWVRLDVSGILPAAAPKAAPAATSSYSPTLSGGEIPRWARTPIEFRKQFFKLLGAGFRGFDGAGNLVVYCEQKAFKLKEDFRVYSDEAKTDEILRIAARQVIDISATYDVRDAKSGAKVGALRRKGLMSTFVRDQWLILDDKDQEIGMIQEDSTLLALVRRFLVNLIPQKYVYTIGSAEVATFQQAFNPFLFKGTLNITGGIDPRLAVAATCLLLAIEGRQT